MSLLKVYNPFPIKIDRAEGCYIYDKTGKAFMDTFAGIGVMSFGHSHPSLLQALKEKMDRYMHTSNFFLDEDAIFVSEKLVNFTGKNGTVYFSNSGAEATEAALKAIKKRATDRRNKIVFFENGFHGRTLGALSINGFKDLRKPFEPLLPNTIELKYNDVEDLSRYFDLFGEETLAVFVEPILGSGGIVSIKPEFASLIEDLKKKYNFILVCDEVQAGLGRTGKIFSYQHFGLSPNIITIGKSIGGGIPLGGAIFLENLSQAFEKGEHGSTFAPNPVALAGARFVVENIPSLLKDVEEKGNYIMQYLREKNFEKVKEVRGKGLMIGIELKEEDPQMREKGLQEGLLLNVLHNSVIRLLPPLNIEYNDIEKMLTKLEKVLK
ncbi:aminotransferase class III [Petrotoga mexicana DSM 14811]|uniref:Aminotransferase class III n=1 Tax=Petrotoga mexicana DSM 14811 TaxID=1122954 RepID=A0A2K1PFE7_9BACT|nr:aspartate aminotransferase family protein [Petrotoga mexicana]PNS01495.1 aminotransferase class III [Petrotoga mexicana DSM 14811]